MKKFLKITFSCILILIVAVVAGAVYFIKTFDLNQYKNELTELVRKQTGREFVIKGDARVVLSLVPTIVIEEIEFSNADWARAPLMAKVKKVEVSFAILPLLRKEIVVDRVSIVEPEIFLEKSKDGKANWSFEKPLEQHSMKPKGKVILAFAQMKEDKLKQKEEMKEALAALAGLFVEEAEIIDGFVQYDDYGAEKPMVADINKLFLSIRKEKTLLSTDVDFDEEKIRVEAVMGTLNDILNDKNFPIDVKALAFGIDAHVVGVLKDLLGDLAFDVKVDAINPKGNMDAPELLVDTNVVGNLSKVDAVINKLEVAKNVISGKVGADISGKLPRVNASLKSDLINLMSFSEEKTAFLIPEIISSASASSLVPDERVPYEMLDKANAKIDLSVGHLIVSEGLEAKNVFVSANLENGVLDINPLKLNFEDGDIKIVSRVISGAKTVSLKGSANNMVLQNLHKEFQVNKADDFGILKGGDMLLDFDVTAVGETYRSLVSSLNGGAVVIVNPSTLQTGRLNFFTSEFLKQVLATVKIASSINKEIDLNCAVVRADFKNGVAEFPRGVAVDTKQINVVSDGKVNLKNDKIEFTLKPFAGKLTDKSIAQALSSFVKITGTIVEPKIAIDNTQAVKTVVGLATSAPAFLGGSMILGSDAAPCYTALKGTAHEGYFPKPLNDEVATEINYKDAEKAIKENLKEIKANSKEELKALKETTKEDIESLKTNSKQLLKGLKDLGKSLK